MRSAARSASHRPTPRTSPPSTSTATGPSTPWTTTSSAAASARCSRTDTRYTLTKRRICSPRCNLASDQRRRFLMRPFPCHFRLTFALVASALSLSSGARADDWPQWQGPDRNAISKEKGLLQDWPKDGPPLAWKVKGLGGGYSAPSIAGGRLFGMSSREGRESVWALSEADGKTIWDTPMG